MFEYQCTTLMWHLPREPKVPTGVIEYSCCLLFDMYYILLPCIYITQTKKEPSLLVKLTSLSLYIQLIDDDLAGPQRESHASECHRTTTASMCPCVMGCLNTQCITLTWHMLRKPETHYTTMHICSHLTSSRREGLMCTHVPEL